MLHIDLDKTPKHSPYYLQILEQIRTLIILGRLLPGKRLPPSRQLAKELGVARRTVVSAYEELCEQGYCTSKVGCGTTVSQIPELIQKDKNDNTYGFPKWLLTDTNYTCHSGDWDTDKICFIPSLSHVKYLPMKKMRQAINQTIIQSIPDVLGHYARNNGDPELIQALCQQVLPTRGIQAMPSQILITNGSQHSSSILSMLISPCGGTISYGVPGYLAIPQNFIMRGMTGVACPVDSEGILLTEAAYASRIHYVMPEHHFPQGMTLSPERRSALLQLAEEHDALIIEDDYDSEFYYERHPLPALKDGDLGGRVIYLGTFSKVLFNSLRLGYIVAHPEIIRRLVDIRWQLDGGTSLILQRWIAQLIISGAVERHLRRMRIRYRKRRDLIALYLQELFPEWSWQLPRGGMQFWIELPEGQSAETILDLAAERGVGLWSGANFREPNACEPNVTAENHHLILGYGAIDEFEIHTAFDRLRDLQQHI